MANDEETEVSQLQKAVLENIWTVISANYEQEKIDYDTWIKATETVVSMFPTKEAFESGEYNEYSWKPVSSKDVLLFRLRLLGKKFPFLIGVYNKYDAKVDNPIYCINCGSELSLTARFCPDCGTKITSPEEEET
jgi:hypothetical protein